MFDPFTIYAVATAAGGILGAIGGKKSGEAAKAAAEGKAFGYEAEGRAYAYKAAVAEMNRKLKLQDADYARWAGESEAQQSGMKTRAGISRARAAQSSGGLDVNFGSASAVRDSMLEIGQLDQSIIRSNAARRAYGYEVEAAGLEAEKTLGEMASDSSKRAAMFARKGGEYAESAGNLSAMKSLIGTAGSISDKWLHAGSMGMSSSFTSNSRGW